MWSLIGDWSGVFDLRRPTVAKVWSNDEGQQWWSGQAASGRVVSLVSLYLSGCVFDWLHSHRFLYAPVRLVVFFFGVEGGWVVVVVKGGGVTPPPHTHYHHHPSFFPPPANSAFSRWHLLPTHLHCVPIMHTDSKSFAWVCTHTQTHWYATKSSFNIV